MKNYIILKKKHLRKLRAIFGRRIRIFMWCISKGCNARCSFCNVYNEKPATPLREKALNAVDGIISLNGALLSITGGEPLLFPVVKDVIDYASNKGLIVQLNTNGSLLAKRHSWLKNANQVCISLDYPDERHNHSRKIPNLLNSIKEGIAECKKDGISVVFSTLYRPGQDIDALVKFADSLKVPVTFCFSEVGGDLHSFAYDNLSKEELKAKVTHVLNLKRRGAGIMNSKKYLENVLEYIETGKHSYKCKAGSWMIYMDQNFQIYPCFYKKKIGTIKEIAKNPELLQKYDFSDCQRCVDSSWGETSVLVEMAKHLNFLELFKELRNFYSVTY